MSTVKGRYPVPIIVAGGVLSGTRRKSRVLVLMSGRATMGGLDELTKDAKYDFMSEGARNNCRVGVAMGSSPTTEDRTRPRVIYAPTIPRKSCAITVASSGVKSKSPRLNKVLVGKFICTLARLRAPPSIVLFCGNKTELATRSSPYVRSLGALRRRKARVLAYKAYIGFCKLGRPTIKAMAGVCAVTRGLAGTKGIVHPWARGRVRAAGTCEGGEGLRGRARAGEGVRGYHETVLGPTTFLASD